MTLAKLQSLARLLSNQAWVRWWAHCNYPRRQPYLMAVQVCDYVRGKMQAVEVPDLLKEGFREERIDGRPVYVVERDPGDYPEEGP